jgi:Kef-type K+ transport system membrane component KefB
MRRYLVPAVLLVPATAAASAGAAHADPVAALALALVIVLAVAKLGGELAVRLGQPAVLGELVAGMLMGNLSLVGVTSLDPLWASPSLDMLARLGVLILLFEVGLESTVGQMMKVGLPSLAVATLGVITPFALGWGASAWLMPTQSLYVHAFVGATLCATSVGITARVFQDLGRLQTAEARIILGAAVIDDVMGLVVLAVVSGTITAANSGAGFSAAGVGLIVLKAAVFLVGSLTIGLFLSPRLFTLASRLQARGVLLALGLAWCFLFAWLSDRIGLAPIVGAFAAGLILEDVHYRSFVDRGEHTLDELIKPISAFLAPVFFVLMGMRTDLRAFAAPGVLGLALVLTIAAVLGKQACSLGVWRPGVDKLTIGLGMIVNGKPVVDRNTFSALVVMIILTTLVTPFALKLSMGRKQTPPAASM